MNPPTMSPYQTIGNICVAIAIIIFLLPLQTRMSAYAQKNLNSDEWAMPVLFILIPLWLVLMAALLCVTASGGFDWLRLGRTALYAFAIGSALGLAFVSFVLIGLFIRPGFTPSFLYWPPLFLIHLATVLLVVLSLNPGLAPGGSPAWLRWPWTVFAGLGLIGGVIFFTPRILRAGTEGMADIAGRILPEGSASPDELAKIAAFDPQDESYFRELIEFADVHHHSEVREAATTRLRSIPEFTTRLAAALESGRNTDALEFVQAATLSPDEQAKLALPTRRALARFTEEIPAPNCMSSERRKQLLKWGRKTLPVIIGKFSDAKVDFSKVMPEFEHALRPDDTRR